MSEHDARPSLARVSLCLDAGENRAYTGTPAQITIGQVDFGGWLVDRVTAPPSQFPGSDAYLVRVSYDVTLAPGTAAPGWVEAGFEFTDDDVVVVDALPRRVRAPVGACKYLLTEQFVFDAAASDGFRHRGDIVLPAVDPDIDVFGIGRARVRWRHTTVPGGTGAVGSQTGWLVLLIPAGSAELRARATAGFASPSAIPAGSRPRAAPVVFTVRLPAGAPVAGVAASLSVRMGFVVDVVGYSQRTEPGQYALQQRLSAFLAEVMAEIGVPLEPEYVQATGDGMNVFLPVSTDISRALPALLASAGSWLHRDNQRHEDRMRRSRVGPTRPDAQCRGLAASPVSFLLSPASMRGRWAAMLVLQRTAHARVIRWLPTAFRRSSAGAPEASREPAGHVGAGAGKPSRIGEDLAVEVWSVRVSAL